MYKTAVYALINGVITHQKQQKNPYEEVSTKLWQIFDDFVTILRFFENRALDYNRRWTWNRAGVTRNRCRPTLVFALTLALPASTSVCATGKWSSWTARWSGVRPLCDWQLAGAPRSSSSDVMCTWPSSAAMCSAEKPPCVGKHPPKHVLAAHLLKLKLTSHHNYSRLSGSDGGATINEQVFSTLICWRRATPHRKNLPQYYQKIVVFSCAFQPSALDCLPNGDE